MRRREPGVHGAGRCGAGQALELRLLGDVGENEPQREGALPGTAAARDAAGGEPAAGDEQEQGPAPAG